MPVREGQFELFEMPAPAAQLSPRFALPFQRSAEVDVSRVCRILGVDKNTVIRLIKLKHLCGYQIHRSKQWRIEYNSVVDYCNHLRLGYRISSRAVAPASGRRLRDEDLLPFPLADTITIAEVRAALDCDRKPVLYMIDEGVLTAYQVRLLAAESPWRIYRRSLERYMESLRASVGSSSRCHSERSEESPHHAPVAASRNRPHSAK